MLEREYKGHEKARLAIEKLSPKDGDLIIITFPEDILREQMDLFSEDLNASLKATIGVEITIVCVKGNVDVNLVTEETLNEAGFFRKTPNDVTEH